MNNKLIIIKGPYKKLYNTKYKLVVLCKCSCGNIKEILHQSILQHKTKSCGCYHKERNKEVQTTHGLRKHSIYAIWKSMKQRCYNFKNKGYKNYGKRGIKVCQEWLDNFQTFYDWAIQNGYKKGLSIERKENNGNYCPENCKWASKQEQANNTRSNNRIYAFNETKTLMQWSKDSRCNVNYDCLKRRIILGWDSEKAITLISKNDKYNNKLICIFNEYKNIKDWSKDIRCVISYKLLYTRINDLDWEPTLALTTPIKIYKNRKMV